MAGHSKWENIKRHKAVVDAKRGKIFQKLSREIYVATRQGGPDEEWNPALRLAIDRARAQNMPKDNIDRAIAKGSSTAEGDNYQRVTYEGYGPKGSAILVQALTDNRNRTAGVVRPAFNHHGGHLGSQGSVAYLFDRKGYIAIDRTTTDLDEDAMMLEVLEAGGEDLEVQEDVFEIYTAFEDFTTVRDQLEKAGYELAVSELTMVPRSSVTLNEAETEAFNKIVEALEEDADIQEVYHNAELFEEGDSN